jgi:hypothetical protein
VLAAASLAAERTAAYLRLGTLILIGLGLVGLGFLAGVYRDWIAAIFALNLGVSIAGVVLARPAVFRSWVPLVMATHSTPPGISPQGSYRYWLKRTSRR